MNAVRHAVTGSLILSLALAVCGRAGETSEYLLVVEQSTVVRSGGFAGIERTYGLAGRFLLRVDREARRASFVHVDARLVAEEGQAGPEDLNGVFHLTELAATVVDEDLIRFISYADDGSAVCLAAVFGSDGSVRLTGATIPPANSADLFVYTLDALARPGCPSAWVSGRYTFAPDESQVVQTGGFAGMQRMYGVAGQFVLDVDAATGAASFISVDATLVGADGSAWPHTLNEVFNLTELAGTVVDDGIIRFIGHAEDSSSVCITLMRLRDGSVRLSGQTIPPANSADFLVFSVDAPVNACCAVDDATGRYELLASRSTLTMTGGLAGIQKVYQLQGSFELLVDSNGGTVRFAEVDLTAIDPAGEAEDRDVDEVLNLSDLMGTPTDDGSILFKGQVADGSNVRVTAIIDGCCAYLLGETIPPAGSADFLIFQLDAVARRLCTELLQDDFADGDPGPLWFAYQPAPELSWFEEVNGRLEANTTAHMENVDALYIADGWQLDVTEPFAVRVDFHFSKIGVGDGRVTLGLAPSIEEPVTGWLVFDVGAFDTDPFYLYEACDGAWVEEVVGPRVSENGTLYMSYTPESDELYLSYTGYGRANAWQTLQGLLQARWQTDSVYVTLGGGSEDGMALTGEDAWLDNFAVDRGTILRREPGQ